MPEEQKLYFRVVDGVVVSNTVEWHQKMHTFLKAEFAQHAKVAKPGMTEVPQEFAGELSAAPTLEAEKQMSSTALHDLRKDREAQMEVKNGWKNRAAPAMVSVIFNETLSASSQQRVEHQSDKELQKALDDNNVIALIKVIKEAHSYRGTSSGMDDHTGFPYILFQRNTHTHSTKPQKHGFFLFFVLFCFLFVCYATTVCLLVFKINCYIHSAATSPTH